MEINPGNRIVGNFKSISTIPAL